MARQSGYTGSRCPGMTETSTQKTTGAVEGKFKVVVTSDRYGNETHGLELEQELAAGVADLDVTLVGRASTSEDDLIRAAQDADALLVSTREVVSRRVLENIPRVKVISRYGVGLDNVDLDAAADAGIVVTHYPGYCTSEVADHAMAMIMALNRRIVEQDRALREGAWVEHGPSRSEEHTSELQSPCNLVCRLLLEKKNIKQST